MGTPIEALFKSALAALRRDKSLQGKVLVSGVTKNTLKAMLDAGDNVAHQANKMISVINAVPLENYHYHYLARTMNCGENEIDDLKGFGGAYRYVRRHSKGHLVTGELIVEWTTNACIFKHYPDNFDSDGKKLRTTPELLHQGYAFRLSNRLAFVGIGKRYCRMMLAVHDEAIAHAVLRGIVTTTDRENNKPMAAAFFMAHETFEGYRSFEDEYRNLERYEQEVLRFDPAPMNGLIRL